MTNMAKMFNNY